MATEKQIRANRENAKRSTGPKSPAGRLKSSRNALRHGLSIPASADPLADVRLEPFLPEGVSQLQRLAVLDMVRVRTELQRVAAVRNGLLADLDLQSPSPEQVRRLAALERYECRAQRQRRRAENQFRSTEPMDDNVE
ncbi:hypothetical protein [Bradyrhizobium sp. BR13661]|jgi:hypothetical protein|uniref:hypothetical protein n=1 Tax=Bradyrhizobium sp. BR13661 TaxID=2940622 RepID=UPI00247685E1|nr:hypothetical protein [Bradyrhizobium sp. BR13661]MDH6261934.1 hypothetical protein [Bradyrhizobium sp. BR13661]